MQELFQVLVALKTDMQRNKNRLAAALGEQARLIWTSMIALLECQIQKTTGKIMALVRDDRQMATQWRLYNSVGGVGPNLALHLIALVDMNQFDNVKMLGAYAGVVPLNCVSGTSVRRAARIAPLCQRVLCTELLRAGVSTMSGKTKDPLIRHNLDKFSNGERQNNVAGRADVQTRERSR